MGKLKSYLLLAWLIAVVLLCPRFTQSSVFNALPSHVIVCNADYNVAYTVAVDPDTGELQDGIIFHDKLQINVDKTLSRSDRESTLIHEILHAVSSQYKLAPRLTEEQVGVLEIGLYETFQKNHWKIVTSHRRRHRR